jgi:hypothetical protein
MSGGERLWSDPRFAWIVAGISQPLDFAILATVSLQILVGWMPALYDPSRRPDA